MHPLRTLLIAGCVQHTLSIPFFPGTSLQLHSSLFKAAGWLDKRGVPPPQCADDAATEEQGCFTLEDASNNKVRFALALGQSFEPGEGIGKGEYGTVSQCVLKDGQDIAVKIKEEGSARREFKCLQLLEGNDHIVKPIAYGKVQGKEALAMELAPDGTLKKRIEEGRYKGKDKEGAFKNVGNQLLDAFAHMHSKTVAHLDLHEGNIVFKGDTVKVIDFDFACRGLDCKSWVPGDGGPETIYDPETASRKNIDPFASEVWTMTIMLLCMTTGANCISSSDDDVRAIWEKDDADKRVEEIRKKWPAFTPEFQELLADILCKQNQRIKMDKLKEDFKDVKIYC